MTAGRKRVWRRCALWASVSLALAAIGPLAPTGTQAVQSSRPNIVILLIDDARVDDLRPAFMPRTNALVGDKGARFRRFYSPFPLCCPARATLLTGQYAHNHGVLWNHPPSGFFAFDDAHTLGTWLDPDYLTGFVGKYLNGYGLNGTDEHYVPPGWDVWQVPTQDRLYHYLSFDVNVNKKLRRVHEYSTRYYGDRAVRFIRQAAGGTEPFFLYTAFVAVHDGQPRTDESSIVSPYVEPRYQGTYTGPKLPQDPSVNEANVSDKHPSLAKQPLLSDADLAHISDKMAQRREALHTVDDEVARVMHTLAATGELHNTYVFVSSDNGYLLGEHRITSGKKALYEPGARVPLLMRGPGVSAGSTITEMTGMMDLAPTVLRLAGHSVRRRALGLALDGRSLLPTLDNRAPRRPVVLEVHGPVTPGDPGRWNQRGLETERYAYLRFVRDGGFEELYDLRADPHELHNVATRPRYHHRLTKMRGLWRQYRNCSGRSCRSGERVEAGQSATGPQ